MNATQPQPAPQGRTPAPPPPPRPQGRGEIKPEDTGMDTSRKKTSLQKAVDALEEAGFHVDRAYEENQRDAGNVSSSSQEERTGAICLRITPEKARA